MRLLSLLLLAASNARGARLERGTTIVTLLCTAAFANAFGSTAKDRPTFSDIWVRNTIADPARFDGWYAQGRQGLTEYTSFTFTGPPGVQYTYNPVYSMLHIEQFTYTETVTKGTTPPVNRSDLFENSFWTEFTFPEHHAWPAIAGKTLIEFLGGLGLHYNYDFTTDGFLVMIDGKTVFEDYWGMQTATSRHRLFSGTKSYCGIMAAMLVADGSLNASAFVTDIVPALQGSGYEGATVRQVMDMTAAIQWEEDVPSCGSGRDPIADEELWSTVRAALEAGEEIPIVEGCENVQYHWVNGLSKFLPSVMYEYFEGKTFTTPGPTTIQDFLTRIKPHQEQNHGEAFTYRTGHTDTLAWIVNETVVSKLGYTGPTDYFSKKIWSQLGQVADAYFVTDYSRVPYFGSGASATLRDYANFGEMLRMDGKNKEGEEVVKEEVVADLFNPKEDPPPKTYPSTYRNQFFKYGEAVIQSGFYGQQVYIHKGHGCVVAKHSHDPCFQHGCPGIAQPNGLPDWYQTMHAFEYICAQASSHAASRGSG